MDSRVSPKEQQGDSIMATKAICDLLDHSAARVILQSCLSVELRSRFFIAQLDVGCFRNRA